MPSAAASDFTASAMLASRSRWSVAKARGEGETRRVVLVPGSAHGTNPAIADAKRVRFAATGEHEVVVALGSNAGNAWGIFARLERFDVTPSQLAAGGYAMPVVV